MKQISYKMLITVPTADETQDPETFLQDKSILCSDDMLEANLAAAKAEAYNSEVTVEDVPDTRPLEVIKAERIQQSKADLAAYLESHPIQWTDGEYYAITAEKQQQLTGKILSATLAQQTSTPYTLTWNSTGQVCKEWTLEELGMEIAPNLFVEGIKGNPQHQYKALSEIDVPAAKAKWEALDAAAQAKEYDEVGKIIDRNYKALCAAFAEGNREKFRAIVLFNS